MPLCPVTILGGLPVIADVWFSGPDYYGEYDAGVDGLYWRLRNGKPGKALPPPVMDRVERDPYWEADVTEQANDYLAYCDEENRALLKETNSCAVASFPCSPTTHGGTVHLTSSSTVAAPAS